MPRLVHLAPLLLAMGTATQVAAAEGATTDYWVRVMPSLWLAKLDGDLSYQRGATAPSKLTTDQLAIGKRENTVMIEAGAQVPFLFGFHAGYSDFSTSGTTTLTQNVTFGTQTYTAATRVQTDVGLRDLWGEICIRPLNLDLVGFSIGVAAHSLDSEFTLVDLGSGQRESLSKNLIIPAGALRAHVTPFLGMTIELRLHYIEVGIAGDHARFAQAAIQASYRPIEWVGVLAGYRYDLYDVHLEDPNGSNSAADANLTLGGPYVGLVAKF
jgi:hypothetical protein